MRIANRRWITAGLALCVSASAALPSAGAASSGSSSPLGANEGVLYGEQLLLKPVATTAGSEAPGFEAANATNNSGMSGFFGPLELHGGESGTMWRTDAYPGADNWLQLDLGAVAPLGRMLIWNYNEPGGAEWGVKHAEVLYSVDGVRWSSAGGPGKKHKLEKATGSPNERASNLTNPVDFAGAPARYVKIVPDSHAASGNWGTGNDKDKHYGVAEVRLYRHANVVDEAGDSIAVARAKAGSERPDALAENAVNNYGMSGVGSRADTHGNEGAAMWSTADAPGAANWIEFDLGGTFPVGELHVWNYNATDSADRGIRWAKVKHSLDGIAWTYANGGAPLEFARASGGAREAASNLTNGSPVDLGGASARYVRIEPNPASDAEAPGNWGGGDAFGLAEARFYSAPGMIVESAPEWTSLFARTEGWTGSDGIFSIAYNGVDAQGASDRTDTLFLFSDTFTGSVDPVTKARDLQGFYNNTLATLEGSVPDPRNARFLWGSDGTGQDFSSIFEPDTPYAYVGTVAANVANNAFGMSPPALPNAPTAVTPPMPTDAHDNQKDGHTMWLSAADGGEHWIKFDLGATYALGRMPIWNYNQYDPAQPNVPYVDRGMKNVKIYYSTDDVAYTELQTDGYPFQFAKADGSPKLPATNLTGGGVVDFGGAAARYVKIVPNAAPGDGNWGGATGGEAAFGLSQVRFYTADGELLRFVEAEADSASSSAPAGNWYWLQDGLSLGDSFYAFPLNMAPDPTQPPGWQFKVVGVAMAKLPNVGGPALTGITQSDTPLYYETVVDYAPGVPGWQWPLKFTYGAGVMPNTAASGASDPDGYIYVYGYRDHAFERNLVVARVPEEKFESFNEWRFWGGSEKGWSRHIEDSALLLPGVNVSPELSVTRMAGGPLDGKYVLVYEKDSLSNTLEYSVADSPTGPFQAPVAFYYAPEPGMNPLTNTYNAKAHPHLSDVGELLISYNVNATDSNQHYVDGTIYRPRWLRMRWIE
ncbi:discoidin domain-containing protein [Paenibacillus antri]|uniref:discoidin domain-containing protein n=1 Tax=Paenibacillus antri TaxID=2582848 RepID=UPI0013052EB9|nr:discoidin domain-containing protein [Paenibacillus antri]